MAKKKKPLLQIQKELLITIASLQMGMSDTDIAEVFNMTKQSVGKILKKE
jgi:transcription initiation factor IIE alpha subunit